MIRQLCFEQNPVDQYLDILFNICKIVSKDISSSFNDFSEAIDISTKSYVEYNTSIIPIKQFCKKYFSYSFEYKAFFTVLTDLQRRNI